ncbi:Centromere protein Cenp-H [Metarhizium album ARSEF 1941]|uniref:Centromere protein Cenp-H n=1 Tax=Metarhizium album (strain ARSEF 1941) TaxID=1081103 RepID=A0A0B2X1D8_METAS|nr:Centromere protein Cenp-H [Metarhizium album ARSEF 1941]KHO00144.1 Centromere protein Cenp-H [Metarhizium album ARSEF 1941]
MEPQDLSMVDEDEQRDEVEAQLPLSLDEQRVLDLFDQLQQLRLEIAIINAQASHVPTTSHNDDEAVSEETQQALLEARANFRLRNDVIESVMTVNPILKAVHNGTNASPPEKDLLPLIEQRDQSAINVAKHAADVADVRSNLTEVQSAMARVIRQNVGLTSTLFELAEEVKQKQASRLDDEETQSEIRRLEAAMRASRQRWRVIKGVASGIVAGSGVDWARDAKLREVVLDLDGDE